MNNKLKSSFLVTKKRLKQQLSTNRIPILLFFIILLTFTMLFVPIPHYETIGQKLTYKTDYKENSSLKFGEQKTTRKGVDGESIVEYRSSRSIFDLLFRKDSIKKEVVSTTVVMAPVKKEISYGSGGSTDAKAPDVGSNTVSSNDAQVTNKIDCQKVYYENTKVYQEFWKYHMDTVNGHINNIYKQDYLTPDEKKQQINRWASYFNDRVNELLAIWKKSMSDQGCSSMPMGFSPGYMPVE